MQLKDILVYLDDGVSNPERVKAALAMAKNYAARLTAVTLASAKPEHLRVTDEKAIRNISEQYAEQRLTDFAALAKGHGVTVDTRVIHGNAAVSARKIAQFSRNFDLLILRQANPKKDNFPIIKEITEQSILLSGRPIYIMPYIGAHRIPCQKAIIAWDGSAAATRAVHDALPLIRFIKEVIILVVKEGKKKTDKNEVLADDMAAHLQRYEVNIRVKKVHSGTFDVPTVILNEIAENDIDLLVMGGYGSPSLKQKIFGGVTRTLLSNMTIPVLMSH